MKTIKQLENEIERKEELSKRLQDIHSELEHVPYEHMTDKEIISYFHNIRKLEKEKAKVIEEFNLFDNDEVLEIELTLLKEIVMEIDFEIETAETEMVNELTDKKYCEAQILVLKHLRTKLIGEAK